MTGPVLEQVLRRDRAVVITALLLITLLAWAYVLRLALDMSAPGMQMSGMRMVPAAGAWMVSVERPWSAAEFLLVVLMWWVMMIGMMTPSVAPLMLIHARIARQAADARQPLAATSWLLGGYLACWAVFSLAATAAQWLLDRAALLAPDMRVAGTRVGGALLVVAGIYQWSPLKRRCLSHCQAPLTFLQMYGGFPARPHRLLGLGMRHGLYCIGCCWALMALLFVGGIMNVLWIAGLSLLVLAEKMLPQGLRLARIIGLALAAAGVTMLLRP